MEHTSAAATASIFDGLLRPCSRIMEDPSLLRDFGTRRLVARPELPGPGPPTADALDLAFRRLLDDQLPRLRAAGVTAWAALGVDPAWHGCRALHQVLHRLSALLSRPEAVAVGAIGLGGGAPWEADLLARHAELARAHALPLVLLASGVPPDAPGGVARALDCLLAERFPPERVLVCGPDEAGAELAAACGCWLGLRPAPSPSLAARTLDLALEHAPDRTLLCSLLGEVGGDVLVLAGAYRHALRGLPPSLKAALFAENACRFYGLHEADAPDA